MNIDYEKLKRSVHSYARDAWAGEWDDDYPWRQGGGEEYLQDVQEKVSALLARTSIEEDAAGAASRAIQAHENLLNWNELVAASNLFKAANNADLRRELLAFLHGDAPVTERLTRFLAWARMPPDGKRRRVVNATVATYLLAMVDPRKHAYCKPKAYNTAVRELLDESPRSAGPERLEHATKLYTEILEFLAQEFGLEKGNLLDVHSILYCLQADGPWSEHAADEAPAPAAPAVDGSGLHDLLKLKTNVVLYGPPGTGKTFRAHRFAGWWERQYGEHSVWRVTFHPSYAYEDFIEGFRPSSGAAKGGAGFALVDGTFKSLCLQAREQPDRSFLLLIDEINRGDMARILGETITLLEGDKRGPDFPVKLQQSQENFYVPANVYVLGTMNMADRSISLMDVAIRRRFWFKYCAPDSDFLATDKGLVREVNGVKLASLLEGINQRIVEHLGDKERVLGHSYLIIDAKTADPLKALRLRVRFEIIPLLEEYCYADRRRMGSILGELVDVDGSPDEDLIDDDKQFAQALQKLCEA